MKTGMFVVAALALLTLSAETIGPNFKDGYDVRPSEIVPRWSGANPGEWTFDYQNALANAKTEGRYTLMLFSAMWWCPHCQPLEKNVLVTDAFKAYVQENGFYLTVLDFPYRDGVSNWCWLWDPSYREAAGIGDWTAQDVSDEFIRRFEFQDAWTKNGALTTNRNVFVEINGGETNLIERSDIPETVYHRVGYPTMIVVKPGGTEAGRFSYSKGIAADVAIDYVVNNIRKIILGDEGKSKLSQNPGEGGVQGTMAAQYAGWLESRSSGETSGTFSIKVGKANKKTRLVKVSATVVRRGGEKVTLTGSCVAPTTNEVVTLVAKKSSCVAEVILGANGLTGVYTDALGMRYAMQGARNVFAAKDPEAKRRAAQLKTGFWTLALMTESAEGGGRAFSRGSCGLTVSVKAKGKVKVSGVMGNGAKLSVSTQGIMGDDGVFAIPVVDKKGGIAFTLLTQGGLIKAVDGLTDWIVTGKTPFVAACKEKHALGSGAGTLPADGLRFELDGLDVPDYGIAGDSISVEFKVDGTKWQGAGFTDDLQLPFDFSLSYAAKTGLFKGQLSLLAHDGKGKVKKLKFKVFGVIVNGVGEGTAILQNAGSFRIRAISICGGDGC